MRWSYSSSRTFKKCQRQWFFKNFVASSRSKEPLRRRAYVLSKLQTVSAWRGKIVDDVISTLIIPGINQRSPVLLRDAKTRARDLFDRQIAFALNHPVGDGDLKASDHGDDFCLLHSVEYGAPPMASELDTAWQEIERALNNLYTLDAIKTPLKAADYIVAQRPLQFDLMDGTTAIAYPDAIAFLDETPPLIVDWKVHTFGQDDAWLQLAIYAIALSRCQHSDFPFDFACDPANVRLLEVQLLTDFIREHRLEPDQIEDAEEYMMSSAYEISCLVEGKKYQELNIHDFMPAAHEESCQTCPYRAPCWETANAH